MAPASAISLISAPAAKAFSLPVSTMQRIAGSSAIADKYSPSRRRTSVVSALRASGRLMRIRPTPSAGRSVNTTGALMANP